MSNNINWFHILRQIDQGNCTPIIGNQVVNSTLFGKQNVVQGWAQRNHYPLADTENLTRVAQFISVKEKDATIAKSEYLQCLRDGLIQVAKEDLNFEPDFLDQLGRSLTFSQLATEILRHPNFAEESEHPLSILAALDIKLYLTTSHHHFIEAALRANGKQPHTQVYAWHDGLLDIIPDDLLLPETGFEPTKEEPLVYHLHGIDDYDTSLVLTEDDHLKFLVNVSQDIRDPKIVPNTVIKALSSSLLILMGYKLHDWDLRVLLGGLIKRQQNRPRSYSVQFVPDTRRENITDPVQFEDYLQEYFEITTDFDVFLGSLEEFTQTLWQEWTAG